MQQRSLGATGLKVSRLGLGTMTWGRDTDEHEARDQLVAFAEAGGDLKPLLDPVPRTPHFDGHFSPDGKKVAFVLDVQPRPDAEPGQGHAPRGG